MKWIAVLCLGAVSAQATTLVALWTPEGVILGADSRVVTDTGSADGCKIGQTGNIWMAASGLVTEARTGYALASIASRTIGDSGPMQERVGRFVDAVHGPLTQALATVRVDSPVDYARVRSGRPVLQTIFAGRENGRPVLATVAFVMGAQGGLEPTGSYVDGSDARGPRLIYAGQQDRIREYLKSHPRWIENDRTALVKTLVQVEIEAGTPFVGGPVDLIRIDASGAEWIEGKPACWSGEKGTRLFQEPRSEVGFFSTRLPARK